MANAPFSGEFESLARQYWDTWSGLLGRGAARDGGGSPADDLPPGMDFEAFDWFSRIRQLAERFAQGSDADASAADIAGAWRQMLGGDGAAPFAGMLHGLAGGAWLEQMRPWLDTLLRPLREQQAEWLSRPAFGPVREHQQRLQALALAWQEWEQRSEAFNVLLGKAGQHAFERFERLLEEHAVPGKRLQSARALFDVWIDAAEEAWAGIALSDEYRHAYAEMTNALMRLRLGVQREVEHVGALLGLPGRSEVDALHRKVADLERTLHAMRQERTAGTTTIAARTSAPGAAKTAPARKRAQAKAAGPAAARATGAARKTLASAGTPAKSARTAAGKAGAATAKVSGGRRSSTTPATGRASATTTKKPVSGTRASAAGAQATAAGKKAAVRPAASRPAPPAHAAAGRRGPDEGGKGDTGVGLVKGQARRKPAQAAKHDDARGGRGA